jgi:hypothetical protein
LLQPHHSKIPRFVPDCCVMAATPGVKNDTGKTVMYGLSHGFFILML